jgi:hypothetical protein
VLETFDEIISRTVDWAFPWDPAYLSASRHPSQRHLLRVMERRLPSYLYYFWNFYHSHEMTLMELIEVDANTFLHGLDVKHFEVCELDGSLGWRAVVTKESLDVE